MLRDEVQKAFPGEDLNALRGNFINNEWVQGDGPSFSIISPSTGEVLAVLNEASQQQTADAVAGVRNWFDNGEPLTPFQRYELLHTVSKEITENLEIYAHLIVAESGKPLKDARGEAARAAQTFRLASEEAKRIHGEEVPLSGTPGSENRIGMTMRMPLGVVCAITPFNAPLNQLNHKAPTALAAGNGVVIKPPEITPLSAIRLTKAIQKAGLPAGAINMIQGRGEVVGEWLLENQDINAYTFTGSAAVGAHIHQKVGLRKTLLELGSNSAVIVHKDADISLASKLIAKAGNVYSGQICISVQRVYVHADVYAEFREALSTEIKKFVVGDPTSESTDIGPMISVEAAERAASWLHDAVEQGAKVVVGGTHDGAWFQPTVVENVTPDMFLVCREVFAPLMNIIPYTDLDDAIKQSNTSIYGLQAGIFTQNIDVAFHAAKKLEVGGVIVNDTSNYRIDQMPYGGIKQSGMGREGVRYAIEELTEPKLIVLNLRTPSL
ncbi:MAG TPA: aldehyde dehydrogenase family protein [Dictyobacter sp.]|nr:aldehyde dehydrogenase family protein [Dictyobacter sp.]